MVPTLIDRLARRAVLRVVGGLAEGHLEVTDHAGTRRFGRGGRHPDLHADLTVVDGRAWRSIAKGGGLGAAEAYLAGWWTSTDVEPVVQVFAANPALLGQGDRLPFGRRKLRREHDTHRNTIAGSRDNVSAHYDLSNDFFALWLDPTMTYSCAWWGDGATTLEAAQRAKLDRITRLLDLGPDDHLLEIGSGWGALALHAAATTGCRVTTTTISRAQHDLASKRVVEAGLTDRVSVLDRDYREVTGTYDKVVSVEMIESVGAEFLGEYLATIDALLEPRGVAVLQAIVIDDREYQRALRTVDFVKRYIFPGGFLPSVEVIAHELAARTRLQLAGLHDMTPDYVRTLHEWRRAFAAAADEVEALGFDARFRRLWDLYLAYCAAGFAERRIGDVQLVLTGPEFRGAVPRP